MSSAASTFARSAARPAFRAAFRRQQFRRDGGRRWESTAGSAQAGPQPSWVKRMWDSPIGLKTVHFWAPVMKWAVVLAGISDLARPAEKLSLTQNAALTATGIIWTRWCLIIKPKNYLLAAVNFFLGIVGIVQVSRIMMYQQSLKAQGEGPGALTAAAEAVEKKAADAKEAVKAAKP
ncbi:hypothetical protein, variant [Gaeumannomyces tritici R3-111a-1]|uniref:Mitochondrial pyruvate carrier n=1 Tax=Gaeumannomyces tritici (strain R3-111a-1) TaxID=644352 RepID=J3PD95_GAET3|nr:hypothetical protein GGTG_11463 [Gaeumannomyces tritici R3-111a-1]XP_009227618.1 hypothetical protein, variant [Gaeumannomyces tritici R3-111a-1]EJT70439.1 hypothetical protein, variant [Gaeumannomyces tritici R3-111a-1]EJT70440.1 hypothetical protein GGTG_11463 [Gaeumannomyces tritici R3-111a-1]